MDNLSLGIAGNEQDDSFHPLEECGGDADSLHAVRTLGVERERAGLHPGLFRCEESSRVAVGAHTEKAEVNTPHWFEFTGKLGGGFLDRKEGLHADQVVLALQGMKHGHEVSCIVVGGVDGNHPLIAKE